MEIIIFVKRCKGTKEDWPLETKGIYTRFFISLIKKKRKKKKERVHVQCIKPVDQLYTIIYMLILSGSL